MLKRLIILIAVTLGIEQVATNGTIKPIGNNGLVKPNSTLELEYDAGSPWMSCFWYRYETEKKYEYCMITAAGDQLVQNCKPKEFGDHVKAIKKADNVCAIEVDKVTEEDNATWAVRVDAELENTIISVVVAKPVDKISIDIPEIKAGSVATITCKAGPGRPAPKVTYEFGDIPNVPVPEVNSTINETSDEDGAFTVKNEIEIKPTAKDFNRTITCSARQMVGDKPLFDEIKAEKRLNVTFAPQPRDDGQGTEEKHLMFGNKVGEDLTVEIKFKANPAPTEIKWAIGKKPKDDEKEENDDWEIVTAGTTSDHYVADELTKIDDIHFMAKLTIKDLKEEDHDVEHKLVVTNPLGENAYWFNVELKEVTTTTTTTTTKAPTSTSGTTNTTTGGDSKSKTSKGVYAVIVIIIVVALAGIGFFMYRKWKSNRVESVP